MKLEENALGSGRHLGRLVKVGSIFVFLVLLLGISSSVLAKPLADELVVRVDGRAVGIDPQIQAELDGRQASLDEVLAALGSGQTAAQQIQVVLPPDNTEIEVTGASAMIQDRTIDLSNLSTTLATYGRIGIWISGKAATGVSWRICIIITWDNANFPVVMVDDRTVTAEDVVAQIDSIDVDYSDLLAFLGDAKVLTPTLEFFDPATPTIPLPLVGVTGTVQTNHIELTGLSNELAARGRIGIWISSGRWRICVIISWSRQANAEVMVDGRAVKVDGVQAQVSGVDVDYGRLLALLGDAKVLTPTLEFFDPATPDTPLLLTGVMGTVQANRIELTGLSHELAARGRIGIWISGGGWRICIIISWSRQANPEVMVDGREVQVDGVQAQVAGVDVEYGRLLALLGDTKVLTPTLEFFDPATPTIPLPLTGVMGTVQANRIELTGLSHELAARGRIGIWISSGGWRLCIIISWSRQANPEVLVDGRAVKVDGVQAQVSGEDVDYGRLLALLGDTKVLTPTLEFFDPATPDIPLPLTGGMGTVQANHIEFTGLSHELAARGKIGIWISSGRWRLCIIISWSRQANAEVMVDGREVKVDGVQAQVAGVDVEYGRLLALLGDAKVLTPTLEFFDPATPDIPLPLVGVMGTVQANQIELTGLSHELAARGRIGIWISSGGWRLCIIISWSRQANAEVMVDGRAVKVDGVQAQVAGEDVDYGRLLALLGDTKVLTPTLEFFDPATPDIPLPLTGVMGTVQANHIELTGLSNELAARGRIGIWISGGGWRVCVIISWSRQANPEVLVDGRGGAVDGVQAQVSGEDVDYGRLLALLGDTKVLTPTLEFFDPATPDIPLRLTGVMGTVQGNQIELTGLSHELAARGRIGIWISSGRWRLCIIISWSRQANAEVMVDGRAVKVDGVQAQVAGVDVDYGRLLALLGDTKVLTPTLEFFDPATPDTPLLLTGVMGTVQANHIELTGLSHELAARGRIGIWISGGGWRICVIISWSRQANAEVMVDGRAVKVDGVQAQVSGVDVDYGRLLALLGDTKVLTPTLEFFDRPRRPSPCP